MRPITIAVALFAALGCRGTQTETAPLGKATDETIQNFLKGCPGASSVLDAGGGQSDLACVASPDHRRSYGVVLDAQKRIVSIHIQEASEEDLQRTFNDVLEPLISPAAVAPLRAPLLTAKGATAETIRIGKRSVAFAISPVSSGGVTANWSLLGPP